MSQRTLVALYGDKTPEFSPFVTGCQQMAAAALGEAFSPYEMGQIHATIVGLEHSEDSPRENASFRRHREQRVEMDIAGFADYLRRSTELPFQARIGGFGESDRPFLSRGYGPYERSFSIQGDKAVVIGWPWHPRAGSGAGDYPGTLDAIRRRAQRFGILHAYHRSETDEDNDLFFRIGLVERSAVGDDAVRDVQRQVRRYISGQRPLMLRIGIDDLCVAAYRDERLPVRSTEILAVAD